MPATVMLLSLVSGISVGAVTVISQTAETSPQVAVMVALPISFSSFCALKMIEPLPHSLTFLISLFLRVKFLPITSMALFCSSLERMSMLSMVTLSAQTEMKSCAAQAPFLLSTSLVTVTSPSPIMVIPSSWIGKYSCPDPVHSKLCTDRGELMSGCRCLLPVSMFHLLSDWRLHLRDHLRL